MTDTRSGITDPAEILAALAELKQLEASDDSLDKVALDDLLDLIGAKDADYGELMLLRDLADLYPVTVPAESGNDVFAMKVLHLRIPVIYSGDSIESATGVARGILDNLGDAWWTGSEGDDFWLCGEKMWLTCEYQEPDDDELIAVYLADNAYPNIEAWGADSDYVQFEGSTDWFYVTPEVPDLPPTPVDLRQQLLNVLRG